MLSVVWVGGANRRVDYWIGGGGEVWGDGGVSNAKWSGWLVSDFTLLVFHTYCSNIIPADCDWPSTAIIHNVLLVSATAAAGVSEIRQSQRQV